MFSVGTRWLEMKNRAKATNASMAAVNTNVKRERGNEWFRFPVIFHDTNKTRALEAIGPLRFMIITRRAFRLRPITE